MNISIFLAQTFGIYFVLAGLAMLVRPAATESFMKAMRDRDLIFASGFIALMVGVPLVLAHNIWDGSWRVMITLLAWLAVAKGVSRIFAPELMYEWIDRLSYNMGIIRAITFCMVLLGIYLTLIGFGIIS